MRVETKSLSRTWWLEFVSITLFAALTVMAARIAIPLPFSPVPVTLQVMTVILSGLVLGSRWGALSQVEYLALGLMGLPVFAGGVGPAALWGPTGGYLLSFPLAAFAAGWVSERLRSNDKLSVLLASLAAITVIYVGGAAWLAVWLGGDVGRAWALGVAPFILADVGKALVAASVVGGGRAFVARLRA